MHDKKLPRSRRFGRTKHRNRRALSDIVGSLIMIATVAGLGVLAFTFANTGLGSLSQNFANLMGSSGNAVSEKFVVEQVTFTTSGTQGANLYVRDVGSNPTTLVSVYLVNQTAGVFVKQVALSSTTVNVGNFANIFVAFTPKHGFTYSFTVTSSLGNSVIYNAKTA